MSWQIVPRACIDLLKDHTSAKTERAMAAMMGMKNLDLAALKRVFKGA